VWCISIYGYNYGRQHSLPVLPTIILSSIRLHAYALHILGIPKKKFSRRFYFSESFAQFMVSDIDSSLNLDCPSSVTSTNTRVSRSKVFLVYEYICPARDNKPKKDFSNGRKLFYCNYCSYGNTVTTNFHQYLFN
jgi:hypothetical protein